jgi:hypothetical protein
VTAATDGERRSAEDVHVGPDGGHRARRMQMAEKKVQPKHPQDDDKKAAGSRKATKTSARRVLHKKASRKQSKKSARKVR